LAIGACSNANRNRSLRFPQLPFDPAGRGHILGETHPGDDPAAVVAHRGEAKQVDPALVGNVQGGFLAGERPPVGRLDDRDDLRRENLEDRVALHELPRQSDLRQAQPAGRHIPQVAVEHEHRALRETLQDLTRDHGPKPADGIPW
jgi:hypothetical protein